MEAIVLAGGFGTRLRHVVSDVPKPMAPVDGRPFLRYILDDLIAKGVSRVVLATGYKSEVIREAFGPSYRGAEIVYSNEDTPLFTGGAVKKALAVCRGEEVFVINGDTFFDVDLAAMRAFKRERGAEFVLAAKPMRDFDRYGTLLLDGEGRVLRFEEKRPTESGVINGGVYLLDRGFLRGVREETFSLEKDVLEKDTAARRLYAFPSEGYFIDIGVPEDYARAQEDFRSRHPLSPAAFFDRDGTINVNTGHLYEPEKLAFIEGRPEMIRSYNEKGVPVIVVTNQAGIAKGLYTEEQMRLLHRVMNERLRAEYCAHVDAFYFCPHHPDYTGPCSCRKPEPGLILQAMREWDVDPAQAVLYGDKPSDMEAARRAGIRGVLLEGKDA